MFNDREAMCLWWTHTRLKTKKRKNTRSHLHFTAHTYMHKQSCVYITRKLVSTGSVHHRMWLRPLRLHPPKRAPGVKNRPLAWKVNRALCLWRRRSGEIKRIQRRPQQLSCAFMFWLVTRRLREPSGRNKSPPLPQTEAWFCTTVYHSYYTRKMQRTLHTSDPTRRSYLFHYASFVSSASVTVDIFFPALLWFLSAFLPRHEPDIDSCAFLPFLYLIV